MRILLVAPQPFFEVRGTPLNVLQICRALTEMGHEVHLATYPLGRDVELPRLTLHRCVRVPGIRHVPIGFSMRKVVLDAFLAVTVYALMLRRRFDVVHAVEESVFFCLPAARFAGVPIIYDLDSSISDQLEYAGVLSNRLLLRWVRDLERAALRRASCALTVCRSLTEFARKLSPETPVFQIEDTPLPASLRDPDPAEVERLRRELDIIGRRALVYTGNLESYQGIDLLMQAIPMVVAEHPEAVVVLVGGSREQLAALRAHAAEIGVGDHVRLAGSCAPEEVPEYMALAEGLLSPRTQGENTPLKIYTYMHSRRPVVATDLPTHTQVLDPSVAVLVPPTPEGFAEGMLRVLSDSDGCAALGAAARERVERQFSFEAFQRKLCDLYAFLAESPLPTGNSRRATSGGGRVSISERREGQRRAG
jgi:glycosyltransferase involved in cell wall biosynthesis